MKGMIFTLIIAAVLAIASYTQLTLFVVPPIGAIPEGKTVVILRLNITKFIDSPDAMCERMKGGVSLICRAGAITTIVENSKILMRLPYSESLYTISTDGMTYSR